MLKLKLYGLTIDLDIQLPASFDLQHYNALTNNADKIAYAKQHVSPEIIISYQNAIGMSMNPTFGCKTRGIRGFAGKRKTEIGIVIQSIPNSSNSRLSIIKDNGKHISTHTVTQKKLIKIAQYGFWVLKTREFN